MKDNFVTNFKAGFMKAFMLLVVFVSISVCANAQYADRDIAIARLEAKSTEVSNAISNLPVNSLDYRFGVVRLFTYKAIYSEIVGKSANVKTAVETVFSSLDSKLDSMGDYLATITEYNKKNKVSGFDTYQVIKNDVKQLLK